jgi:hypothetical protein
MMNRKLLTHVLMVSLLVLGACTQKRQQIFSQGKGQNLDSIETWNEQFINIDTGDTIGTPDTTWAQGSVSVSNKVKAMNHFDFVQLKVQNPKFKTIIGNPPFRGRPNTHGVYQIEVKLTENYLKLLKVAKKEDLPFEEHFYIEETLRDGRVAIPILGYKIKGFYKVEAEKTADDQDSHHLTEIEEEDPAQATHVRIDWSSREVFEPIQKVDLFPSEIFFARDAKTNKFKPYEWYYAETVTEKSLNDTDTIVGENNIQSEYSSLAPASKVIFLPREGELRVVNVARDERLSRDQVEQTADLNSEATMVLPIAWKDYRLKAEGTNLALKDEGVAERRWDQRNYFTINFPSVQSAGISGGNTSLMDIEVDQNYLSFSVKNTVGNKSRTIHYSFLRVDQGRLPYAAKISTQEDRRTFGFFTTKKPYIANWEYYTKDDLRKRVYMNRMNPDQKEIVFHLSYDSPKEFEDIAEMAVNAWNKTFEEALGSNQIHVSFSPDRVSLGDLRYNVIHLVNTLNEDGLLGFGPSIADPETGEIISASTNVYVNSIQAIAVGSVRQYMIDRIEGRLKADQPNSSGAILTDAPASSKSAPVSLSAKKLIEMKSLLQAGSRIDADRFSKLVQITKDEAKKQANDLANQRCTYAEEAALSSNDRDIEKFCPEIEKIIASKQGLSYADAGGEKNWESLWTSSKEAIRECSLQITRGKLLSTLIHEIGHNFGLRHNFAGSYDKANFKEVKTIFGEKVTAHSSSIMEYTNWDEDRLTETGAYDIAAIRFGYGNTVEMKDGSKINVGTDSIATALSGKSQSPKNLKPYLFCTDEDAGSGMNALCRQEDAGTTPKEIVQSFIERYNRTESLRKFRRAIPGVAANNVVGSRNLQMTFLPLREIYDEWRVRLGEYVKKSNRYLTDYDEKSYQSVLDSMKADPQFGPIYDQYFEASRMIYDFLKSVAFQHDEYCLINDRGVTRATEFVTLRDLLSEATRGAVSIRSCAEAQSAAELAPVLNADAPKVLAQIGYPVSSYRYTKYESSLEDLSDDVLGNSETREYALVAMTSRIPNIRAILDDFTPSMLDEPTLFKDLVMTYLERASQGVNLKDQKIADYQPLFNSESDLLRQGAASLSAGLTIPGDTLGSVNKVASMNRFRFFGVHAPVPGEDISKATAVLRIDGRVRYVAEAKENGMANLLIDQYNQVEHNLKLQPVSVEFQQKAAELISKALPAAADAPNMTLKEFETLSALLDQIEANTGDLLECLGTTSPNLEQLVKANYFYKLVRDQTAQKGDEAMDGLFKLNIMQLIKAIEGTEVLFTADKVTNLSEASKACGQQQNATVVKYQNYAKDFEAQKGLLLNILGMYSD